MGRRGGIFFGGNMGFADLIGGIFVLALGIAVIVFSAQLSYMSEFGPGPGFLPLWLGIGLVGCSLFVIVRNIRRHSQGGTFFKPRTKLAVRMLLTIVVAFLLFPFLGFPIGLALFTAFTMRMMGRHSLILCGLTAFVTAIGIHFVFGQWLYIPLPKGLIGW
jgi:hypothetical protein